MDWGYLPHGTNTPAAGSRIQVLGKPASKINMPLRGKTAPGRKGHHQIIKTHLRASPPPAAPCILVPPPWKAISCASPTLWI